MLDLAPRARPDSLTFTSAQLKRVIDEYELQVSVVEAQHAKTIYCYRLIAELHQRSFITARQTMDWMVMLDQTVDYGPPYRDLWNQYSMRFISDYLDVMLKLDRIAAMRLAEEVDRTLYLPPIPPEKPGLITRIFAAILGRRAE